MASFKKHHEDKSLEKGAKKEEIQLSSKPPIETHKTSEKKGKYSNASLSTSALVSSALASNTCSRSCLRPKRTFSSVSMIDKTLTPIKKIPNLSTSSSLLLQDYPSKKENFLFKISSSVEFPSHFSFNTENELASKNVNPSKKVTFGEKKLASNLFSRENQDLNPS